MVKCLTAEILTRAADSALSKALRRDRRFGIVRYDFGCWGYDGSCCFGSKENAIYKSEMKQLYPDLEYLHDYVDRKSAELRRSETELCGIIN
jgi:hypothetical protein